MEGTEEPMSETHSQPKADLNLFPMLKKLPFSEVYADLLIEAYDIHPFYIVGAIFILHILYLCYCLFKWDYRTINELQYYIPRVRRYIGSLVGIISFIMYLKCRFVSDGQLALTCCILSTVAALLLYDLDAMLRFFLGVSLNVLGLNLIVPSILSGFIEFSTPRFCVGTFHCLLGIMYLILLARRGEIGILDQWNLANGHIN